jgi:ABC-type antimicrobial peptide transport system permease subunit
MRPSLRSWVWRVPIEDEFDEEVAFHLEMRTRELLALALAMVGVFGIMAYSVERRVRDLAVRRAVGATTRDVLALVLGSAAKVVGAGAVIGLVLPAALGRLLVTLLFGRGRPEGLLYRDTVMNSDTGSAADVNRAFATAPWK